MYEGLGNVEVWEVTKRYTSSSKVARKDTSIFDVQGIQVKKHTQYFLSCIIIKWKWGHDHDFKDKQWGSKNRGSSY